MPATKGSRYACRVHNVWHADCREAFHPPKPTRRQQLPAVTVAYPFDQESRSEDRYPNDFSRPAAKKERNRSIDQAKRATIGSKKRTFFPQIQKQKNLKARNTPSLSPPQPQGQGAKPTYTNQPITLTSRTPLQRPAYPYQEAHKPYLPPSRRPGPRTHDCVAPSLKPILGQRGRRWCSTTSQV